MKITLMTKTMLGMMITLMTPMTYLPGMRMTNELFGRNEDDSNYLFGRNEDDSNDLFGRNEDD